MLGRNRFLQADTNPGTKTLRIRLRPECDAVKMTETEILPRYSYQDTS